MKKINFLAVITARKNSKRLKDKNIKTLNGIPLLVLPYLWASKVKDIDEIVLSSDSSKYRKIASEFGLKSLERPKYLSLDKSKSEDALLHVIEEYNKNNISIKNIILLQPTNPIFESAQLQDAIKLFKKSSYASLQTYVNSSKFMINDQDIFDRPMTQFKKIRKVETGCFWIINVNKFKKMKNRVIKPTLNYELPRNSLIDIDFEEDFFIAEALLSKRINTYFNNYYSARLKKVDTNFKNYYSKKNIDPDGKIRNFHSKVEREKRILLCKEEINYINSLPSKSKKMNFLDLGFGMGHIASAIDNDKFIKFGFEYSKASGKYGKKYFKEVEYGKIPKFKLNQFDVILCHHVIEHVSNPIKYISRINKITKMGGKLIISTPDFNHDFSKYFGKNYRMLHDETHISLFGEEGLRLLLKDHGYEINKIAKPFIGTPFFNKINLNRLSNNKKISPPFHGSWMSFYCTKKYKV